MYVPFCYKIGLELVVSVWQEKNFVPNVMHYCFLLQTFPNHFPRD
jgi:hypothetical protein